MRSFLGVFLPRVVRLLVGAALFMSAACGSKPKEPTPSFSCPNTLSKALAFSHLKEAHLSLETMTVEAAKNAVALTTDGLSCAPPKGKASAATVARLLVERARASASLDDNESALADLEAALLWAARGSQEDPLVLPEIHLSRAQLLLRTQEHEQAAKSAARARDAAARLGKQAAAFECEALLLEGGLAHRLSEGEHPPDWYFRRVFEVAERHGYPETIWDAVERASFGLDLRASEREELLRPVQTLKETEEKAKTEGGSVTSRDRKSPGEMVSLSSGSISGAEQTVSAMQPGFRSCFERTASELSGGRALLSIAVGPDGTVQRVEAQSQDMSPATLECLKQEAEGATFNPPETDQAVLSVPVTFVKQ